MAKYQDAKKVRLKANLVHHSQIPLFFHKLGKEKDKERRQSVTAAEVTLSMCADAGKVDRTKLSQTEVRLILSI